MSLASKFRTFIKFSKQGPIPLAGETLRALFGANFQKFYDAKHKDATAILGFDPNTLDSQTLSCFISQFLCNKNNKIATISIEDFLCDPVIVNFVSPADCERLAVLFNANGSDKSSKHDYYRVYQPILGLLLSMINQVNLTEIGIGTNNIDVLSNMGMRGTPGGSLRAFRDFSNKIAVFGADIDRRILFDEERIFTCYVDQLQPSTIQILIDNTSPDLLIDDGLHALRANINVLCEFISYAKTSKNKWLIIEDLGFDQELSACWEFILKLVQEVFGFNVWLVRTKNSHIVVIQT